MLDKRTIGGIGYSIIYFLALFFGELTFQILMLIFLFIGIYEIIKITLKSKSLIYCVFYAVIYFIGIYFLILLVQQSIGLVFYLSLLVMLSDTMAFFIGKNFGKHKLAKVSPNKTIEGAVGGLLVSPIVAIGFTELISLIIRNDFFGLHFSALQNYYEFDNLFILYVVSIVVVIFAQIGDLLQSKLKRLADVKDSGSIVYGHGGILDRTDSLVVAAIALFIINLILV